MVADDLVMLGATASAATAFPQVGTDYFLASTEM